MISNGVSWRVQGEGSTPADASTLVTLATAQDVSGAKTFTAQTNFQNSAGLGTIRLSPATGSGESGVGLYYNSDRSLATDGDLWFMSSSSFSTARRFAILSRGNTTASMRLSITTAGLVTIPGALQVGSAIGTVTVGGAGQSGQITGVSVDHAILLRGDTTTASLNYTITPGDTCAFIEYGGTWRFRQVQNGLNAVRLETVSYTHLTLPTKA